MTRIALSILLAVASAGALAFGASRTAAPGAAATPMLTLAATGTPVKTGTAAPATTPVPANALRLRVVNDLNGDGLADPGEPGLGGWQIYGGCSDAIVVLTTDDDEYAVALSAGPDAGGSPGCYRVQRPFGWLPTRALSAEIPGTFDRSAPYLFMFQDLGRTAMELAGEFLNSSGLPGEQGDPSVAEPFRKCGHFFVSHYAPSEIRVAVIVVGSDREPGCPSSGVEVTPADSGRPAGAGIPFSPGPSIGATFATGSESMRFYATDVTGASVLDVAAGTVTTDCAVVIPVQGFVPPGYVRVFVLADKARPGCGAPGRLVQLYRDGQALTPSLDWRPGVIEVGELVPGKPSVIIPPNTGSAGLLPGARAD